MRISKNCDRSRLMFPTRLFLFISLAILGIVLAGCMPVQMSPTPVSTPSATITTLPTEAAPPATATFPPLPTDSSLALLPSPTMTLTAPPSPTPTPTQTPIPLPDVLPKFPLDGYVLLFAKDGDLYFQDGETIPIKLTHVGEEHAAILSDDGKKVVFFQQNYRDIYSIDVDGSHEQLLVKNRPLAEYTGRYSQFIPNTHILLFNTYQQCETQEKTTLCATGVSSVDTDTAEIKELVKPDKVGLYTTVSNFNASPDGKMIAVEYPGYIDILDINGKVIRRNVIPYTPSIPSVIGLSLLPSTSWLPDSSRLIVVVPDDVQFVAGFDMPAYSVWRYDMDTAAATRISLTPSLVDLPVATCGGHGVSPDGKWILYYGSEDYTHNPLDGTYSLYIGNLRNGQVQRYDELYCWGGGGWGPDSKHFSYGDRLGNVGKPAITIIFSQLNRWVDDFHFIFAESGPIHVSEIKTFVAEIRGDTVVYFDLGIPYFDLVTIKPKR